MLRLLYEREKAGLYTTGVLEPTVDGEAVGSQAGAGSGSPPNIEKRLPLATASGVGCALLATDGGGGSLRGGLSWTGGGVLAGVSGALALLTSLAPVLRCDGDGPLKEWLRRRAAPLPAAAVRRRSAGRGVQAVGGRVGPGPNYGAHGGCQGGGQVQAGR